MVVVMKHLNHVEQNIYIILVGKLLVVLVPEIYFANSKFSKRGITI